MCKVTLGALILAATYPCDIGPHLSVVDLGIVLRNPVPVNSFYRLVNIFDVGIWTMILGTLSAFAMLFWSVYSVYENNGMTHLLAKRADTADFVLLTFLASTEPQPFKCFRHRSAGPVPGTIDIQEHITDN